VMTISVVSLSSRMSVRTIAVKSVVSFWESGSGRGVWVATRVYAGMPSLQQSTRDDDARQGWTYGSLEKIVGVMLHIFRLSTSDCAISSR
jgi:hypothetical protein